MCAALGSALGVGISVANDSKGVTLSDDYKSIIGFLGSIWINALKLLVLPLIVLMMIILPSRVEEIGSVGKKAIPFYLLTSTLSSIQGLTWANIVNPGRNKNSEGIYYNYNCLTENRN